LRIAEQEGIGGQVTATGASSKDNLILGTRYAWRKPNRPPSAPMDLLEKLLSQQDLI